MKRIHYANGTILVNLPVAEAVMAYANVLALVDSADVIAIPALDANGAIRRIQLLIGPASQILAIETDDDDVAMLGADEAIADLTTRMRNRLPDTAGLVATADGGAASDRDVGAP